ncbi:MAG: L-ornithine Nalpha-acyltransferase, partial [Variibacter sp.]|nr:L-ornithine Nalpha-acyltransferase [Variibacter sp.]
MSNNFAMALRNGWRSAKAVALVPTLRAYAGLRVAEARGAETPETLGRLGTLEVRLARTAKEVRRAQKLRYHVFYEEKRAIADTTTKLAGRDVDAFDAICDHLLVLGHAPDARTRRGKPLVVGTYRLLRQDVAARHGGFYTAGEFAVGE